MLQRENTTEEPTAVFTENELNVLDKLLKPKRHETSQPRSLFNHIRKMAKLGGYLARASDPPPGNLVVWRGFSRLNDIHLGMLLAKRNVGNCKDRRTLTLWVLDEMRHGLHGFTRQVWGLPGHRPVAATQHVYQWGYVYGAVGLGLARSEFLLAETVDQAHFGQFYRIRTPVHMVPSNRGI